MSKEMTNEQYKQAKANLIAKAWLDDAFRGLLASNPAEALAQVGISLPSESKIAVHFDTNCITNIIIPKMPSEQGVSEEALKAASEQAANEVQLVLPTILLVK